MENNYVNKSPETFVHFNQKTYNPSSKYKKMENKNKNHLENIINKNSYTFLHSKKLNNKKNSKNESLIDFTEPEPQTYQGFIQMNYKNNSFDIVTNQDINNIQNSKEKKGNKKMNNISNRNNKKLLEEYFQLKKENNSYNTLNNMNNNQIEVYKPLVKKNKVKKNNDQSKDVSFKKSKSLKSEFLKIYQPEKNITNSPSFTPIKSNFQKQKKIKEKKSTLYCNSKSNSNISNNCKNIVNNNFTQRKYINSKHNNSKRSKYNDDLKNDRLRIGSRTPTIRKNLTPTKIKGIWIENNINYDKTYSIDRNEKKNKKNNYIYSSNNLNLNNNYNIPHINSTEVYWKRKDKEKEQKLERIRTERILQEEKELQDRPKINQNSRKIINRKKYQNNDVFNRLSDLNQIKNHNLQIEKMREKFTENHTPYINDNSRRMKRTIDDLYIWKNKNERKKTESANNFNKMMKGNQIKINPLSEEILREKKSEYLNKKVEDRLLEQGRIQQYKNEIERQKYIINITTGKKYINNDYINVHSRYLESPDSTNDNFNKNNYKSCDRIIKKANKSNYKSLSLNDNININNNSLDFSDESNKYYQNEINNFNNLNEKEIYFNNNGNKLINGNINYIYNNNIIQNSKKNNLNNQKRTQENNSNDIIDINNNIKNNNYKYFPDYKNMNNQNEANDLKNKNNFYFNKKNYQTENNYNYKNKVQLGEQFNYNKIKNNGPTKLINKNEEISYNRSNINTNLNSYNNMNKFEKNEVMNIRRCLNEFYENKKMMKEKNNSKNISEQSNEIEKSSIKNESIKNDLLKSLLNNNNGQNNEYCYNTFNNKPIEREILNIQKSVNNDFILNKDNYQQIIDKENNIQMNPRYNFKPEIIKNINKIPKSSGLNFNQNKNINSFQFEFNRSNRNILELNNEYNHNKNIKENNHQNNINNKKTIEDSINLNGLVHNSDIINNNENNSNYKIKENYDDIEKERRKKDLFQMINFSSNLGANIKYLSNNNQQNIKIGLKDNYNDYDNFNGVQSYEEN